ncbi:OmpP1/FadL family transporter [Pseudocolwellia sp. HL-MZ19]|uniref:OmpP1/FadL family transporter n=1 Tax=unclassified Pseudocolwellia TaxID=2848178 RepID=UPI003CEB7FBE
MFNNKNLNKKVLASTVAMSIISGNTLAGAIDFSGMPMIKLFEEGTFIEATYSQILVDFSGKDVAGFDTGDLTDDIKVYSFTYKQDINEKLSFALIKDTPFYNETTYDEGIFAGVKNKVKVDSITGLLRYKLNENWAVHGGVSGHKKNATTLVPTTLVEGGYTLEAKGNVSFGYVAGATYEIPQYHVLVGLTYFSEVDQELDATENGVETGKFDVTTPESVNLDFRFPVSTKNLVFGTVRWAHWNGYEVKPPSGFPIANTSDDSYKYSLGAVHLFTDQWVGFVRGGYESGPNDEQTLNGFYGNIKQLGIGASYTQDKIKVTGFVNRIVTEAKTGIVGSFDDGSATMLTLSIQYNF